MVLACTGIHMVEQVPPNGFCQCLCPEGELQFSPASL